MFCEMGKCFYFYILLFMAFLYLWNSIGSCSVRGNMYRGNDNVSQPMRKTYIACHKLCLTFWSFYCLFHVTQTCEYTYSKEHRYIHQKHGMNPLIRVYFPHPKSKLIFWVFWPFFDLQNLWVHSRSVFQITPRNGIGIVWNVFQSTVKNIHQNHNQWNHAYSRILHLYCITWVRVCTYVEKYPSKIRVIHAHQNPEICMNTNF